MLQPTGPLPPAVYWRRRAVALAGLVLVLLMLIWLVATVAGGEPGAPAPPAAEQPAPTGEPAPATSDPSTTVTASSNADQTSTTTAAEPTSSPAAPPSEPAPPAPTTQPEPPPGPPQPCPDEAVRVTAQPEQPEYRVGSKPVFRLTVANTGPVACTRDLDAGLQELLVYAADGTTRLWSSNDCYPGDGTDVRTLQPGEHVTFPVTWAGRSSQPQCAGQRVQIPAGDYLVVGKLGPLTSEPAPFKLLR